MTSYISMSSSQPRERTLVAVVCTIRVVEKCQHFSFLFCKMQLRNCFLSLGGSLIDKNDIKRKLALN